MQQYTRGIARILKAGNGLQPLIESATPPIIYSYFADLCSQTLEIERGIEKYVSLDSLVGKELLVFTELIPANNSNNPKWNLWWVKDGDRKYINTEGFLAYRNARKMACSSCL